MLTMVIGIHIAAGLNAVTARDSPSTHHPRSAPTLHTEADNRPRSKDHR